MKRIAGFLHLTDRDGDQLLLRADGVLIIETIHDRTCNACLRSKPLGP